MNRLLSLTLMFCAVLAHAQGPSVQEIYHMNRLMLNTLDDYARTGSLATPDDVRDFLGLFESTGTECIFNDILGTSGYKSKTTPLAYSASFKTDAGSLLSFELSKVRKVGDFFQSNGKWHRKIKVNKYLLFIDGAVYSGEAGGIFFDTKQFYPKEDGLLHLVIDMVYDKASDRALISSITLENSLPDSAVDSKSFAVVLKPDQVVSGEVLYKGLPLEYNEYGQSFIKSKDLTFSNEDYSLRTKTVATSDRYDVMSLSFKRLHHWRIKPRFSTTLGSAFKMVDFPDNVNFTNSSKATEFGVDFGLLFSTGRRSRTGLYLGAAYSSSQIDFTGGGFKYDFIESNEFVINSMKESYSYKDIVIPVYLENEFTLGDYVNLSIDLGAKLYVTQSCDVNTPFTVDGTYAGNEFHLNADNNGLLDPGIYGKNSQELTFFANLEVDVNLARKMWYLFVAAGYEFGSQSMMPTYSPETIKTFYAPTGNTAVYPVVHGSERNYLFRSLVQSVSFHRQSLWLSVGLKIKLDI